MPTMAGIILGDLLQQKGVKGPSALGRDLKISKQHAWLLWHGHVLPSLPMAKRLQERYKLAPKDLLALERRPPSD